MPQTKLVEFTSDNMVALTFLAEQAQVAPQEYLEQTMLVGVYLAQVALDAEEDKTPEVLFEQPDELFHTYPINFSPRIEPLDTEEALLEATIGYERYTLAVNHKLLELVDIAATLLKTDRGSFIQRSEEYRKLWHATRERGGTILLNTTHEAPGVYLIA